MLPNPETQHQNKHIIPEKEIDLGVKVSVLMVTYNHEKFIAKALDSILQQQHDYTLEIIVGDDLSQDQTRKILKEYQTNYPGIVRLLFNEKNIGPSKNYLQVLEACRGEYVAMLDGDDYWTDPLKLHKQIEFLDAHPDYVLSCHRFKRHYLSEDRMDVDLYPKLYDGNPAGFTIDPDKFFTHWVTQTLTVVFRRSAIDLEEYKGYLHFDDMPLFFCLLQKGKGYAHNFFGGMYNCHAGGVFTILSWRGLMHLNLTFTTELLKRYKNSWPLQRAHAVYLYEYLVADFKERKASKKFPIRLSNLIWLRVTDFKELFWRTVWWIKFLGRKLRTLFQKPTIT